VRVTTPTAKADGFSGNRNHCRGWLLTAVPPPKYVSGRVQIAVSKVATGGAVIHPVTQTQRLGGL